MFADQIILCTLIFIQRSRHEVEKNTGRVSDATKKLYETVPSFTSFSPARAVHCLLLSSRSQVTLSPIRLDVV